jgi:hypothetical protein
MLYLEYADVSALSPGPTRRASQSGVVPPHSKSSVQSYVYPIMRRLISIWRAFHVMPNCCTDVVFGRLCSGGPPMAFNLAGAPDGLE